MLINLGIGMSLLLTLVGVSQPVLTHVIGDL